MIPEKVKAVRHLNAEADDARHDYTSRGHTGIANTSVITLIQTNIRRLSRSVSILSARFLSNISIVVVSTSKGRNLRVRHDLALIRIKGVEANLPHVWPRTNGRRGIG